MTMFSIDIMDFDAYSVVGLAIKKLYRWGNKYFDNGGFKPAIKRITKKV